MRHGVLRAGSLPFTCNETQQIFGTQESALATGWAQFVPAMAAGIEGGSRVRP